MNHAAPAPLRTEAIRYNLILCQRFPLACFNSDQIDKGPRVYRQPEVERQKSEDNLKNNEAEGNQILVRSKVSKIDEIKRLPNLNGLFKINDLYHRQITILYSAKLTTISA